MTRRALASFLAGCIISAVCLWYAFRGVELSAVIAGIGRVGWSWVTACILASWLSLGIRAVRWHFLLSGVKVMRGRSLLSATFIGFMANNLLPARLGELVRAWALSRREQLPVPTILASIVVERLLDTLAALAILGIALAVAPDLEEGSSRLLQATGTVVLSLVAGMIVLIMVAMRFRERLFRRIQTWMAGTTRPWKLKAVALADAFFEGLGGLKARDRATVAGLSLVVWATAIASFHVLSEGFGLDLSLVQTTLVFVIVLFGVAVPSAPGFVGTFHAFCVAGLGMVAGTDPTLAAAYATLLHGAQWLSVNLVGLAFLLVDRTFSWNRVLPAPCQN